MELHGKNIIGGRLCAGGTRSFAAVNPETNERLEPVFTEATETEVGRALELAAAAFVEYRRKTPEERAAFLDAIGAEIMALGDELIKRANAETALPHARLMAERTRTIGQFGLFAKLIREGSWVDARIERAQPGRKPAPKPDLRRMLAPIGPVAVFGASNFPLAYSVAGGDTAAALAAGNPVVVKAHPGHPGTSELTMRALQAAAQGRALPAGVVSMVHGATNAVGMALVKHPCTKAVGFTGSLQGGRALWEAAAARPEPIPVYAEMGSTNPVFVLPGALAARAAEIAEGLVQSVTMGVGQFCTCPGLVFGVRGAAFDAFVGHVARLAAQVPPGTMLHSRLCARYREGVEEFEKLPGVKTAGRASGAEHQKTQAGAVIFVTDAETFLKTPRLHEELFGPATVIVGCASTGELATVAGRLPGQLTASIHATLEDLQECRPLAEVLTQRAGRVVYNGFPTGVEVCAAMHHGGPYPATIFPHFTSVGTAGILRFVRPVCYQNCPPELLPLELQDRNAGHIWRLVDGELTKADVES